MGNVDLLAPAGCVRLMVVVLMMVPPTLPGGGISQAVLLPPSTEFNIWIPLPGEALLTGVTLIS